MITPELKLETFYKGSDWIVCPSAVEYLCGQTPPKIKLRITSRWHKGGKRFVAYRRNSYINCKFKDNVFQPVRQIERWFEDQLDYGETKTFYVSVLL